MELILKPVSTWVVPAKEIVLRHTGNTSNDFISIWKALDYLLAEFQLKADLVQLFGYYQYQPAVRCSISKKFVIKEATTSFNKLISAVLNAEITARPFTTLEVADYLGCSVDEITADLKKLKNIGYEVRSSSTNIAIDNDIFLIPYSFPSLTPQSVQLNKGL